MWTPSSALITIGNLSINWYGVLMAAGVLLGLLLAAKLAKRDYGISFDTMTDLCLLTVPLALIGARLYYVAFSWDQYYYEPIKILYIWEGGLALYGATIGGMIALAIFSLWKKIKFLKITDCVAPAMALGQAIGRWGNFFNQEAFGNRVENPLWQWFPASVWIENPFGSGVPGWYQATFFYESMACLLIVGILLLYAKKAKKRQAGDLLFLYLLLYGIERACVEGLRTDSLYLGNIRASQWLSIVFIVCSVVALILLHVFKKNPVKAGEGLALLAEAEAQKNAESQSAPFVPSGEEPQNTDASDSAQEAAAQEKETAEEKPEPSAEASEETPTETEKPQDSIPKTADIENK